MSLDVTRRRLLWLAGATTALGAMTGAARAEGGVLQLLQQREAANAPATELPFATQTPIRCGQAALRVRDLPAMIGFYQQTIGLKLLDRRADSAVLGVDGVPLLHLISRPEAPFEPRDRAGLFHIAFLMPSRAELARWLVHAAILRIPLSGFADHSVSEAVYLDDPEGNGLEVYSDRPRDSWRWNGDVVTMGTHTLDIDSIVALVPTDRDTFAGAPDKLRIGHMHLRVGDIASGRAFYEQTLGLASTRGQNAQSAFLASGGYHHHVALNTWNSAGAGARDTGTTGLDWFSLQVSDEALMAGQVDRLRERSLTVTDIAGGVACVDPWGTSLRLVRA